MTISGVPFDSIAGRYDKTQTRTLPREAIEDMVGMLSRELEGAGPCLAIGVGTGRMELPLSQKGIELVGSDLSLPMMTQMADAAHRLPFPLVQASATCLPFQKASFGAGMGCMVFHVIPAWREAVDELMRVVQPGGRLLFQHPWSWDAPVGGEVLRHFGEQVGLIRQLPGLQSIEELYEYCLKRHGLAGRWLPKIYFTVKRSVEDIIGQLERREQAWTWEIEDDRMQLAAAQTRSWAQARFGSLETKREIRTPIRWLMYQLPA